MMPGNTPANTSFEEAAAVPGMGNTALHFVRDLAHVEEGQRVLINEASGGTGTIAVQLAKYYGAEVTGVCSSANHEPIQSLGADDVIDYTDEDFTQNGETYAVIFDAVGKSSFSRCKGSLPEKGMYLDNVPRLSTLLQMSWTSVVGGKRVKMEGAPAILENLLTLKDLMEAGKLTTFIDKRFPLEQTAAASEYVEEGHKKGNVVITVATS